MEEQNEKLDDLTKVHLWNGKNRKGYNKSKDKLFIFIKKTKCTKREIKYFNFTKVIISVVKSLSLNKMNNK